jgi:hypothetical protein
MYSVEMESTPIINNTNNSAAETSKIYTSRGTLKNPKQNHAIDPMVTTASSDVAEYTRETNDHDTLDNRDAQGIAEDQNTALTSRKPHDEQRGSNDVEMGSDIHNTSINTHACEQVPAVAPAGQESGEPQLLTGKPAGGIVARLSGEPVQSISEAVESLGTDDTKMEIDPSSVSTSTASPPQSHSTASQASEAASPRSTTKFTPQEITLAELKVQKAALLASLVALPAIQVLIEENQSSGVDASEDDGEPTDADVTAAANRMVKEHIKLLHEYNELKDAGQGLMGLIADQRGVRIVEVQDEFGIDAND